MEFKQTSLTVIPPPPVQLAHTLVSPPSCIVGGGIPMKTTETKHVRVLDLVGFHFHALPAQTNT